MLCDNLEGCEDGEGDGREVPEGGGICVPVADSCWGVAETSTILQSNYLPKNNLKKYQSKTDGSPALAGMPTASLNRPCPLPFQGRLLR